MNNQELFNATINDAISYFNMIVNDDEPVAPKSTATLYGFHKPIITAQLEAIEIDHLVTEIKAAVLFNADHQGFYL